MAKETAPVPTVDDLRNLYAQRLEITSQYPMDRDAKASKDEEIQICVNHMHLPKPDEKRWQTEPVMAQIELEASKRNPEAARLLTYPTEKINLFQRGPGEDLIPNQDVIYQGVRLTIPRGRKLLVPSVVSDLLEQGGIR